MLSKLDSLQERVDNCQPNLLCLGETHMQEEHKIIVPWYETIYQNAMFEFQLKSCRQNNLPQQCLGNFFADVIKQISVFALAIPSAVLGTYYSNVVLFN